MPWLVKFGGQALNTEDLTLDEMEAMVKACDSDEPWILLNPVRHIGFAKACIAMCLIKAGMDDGAARTKVGALTVKEIQGAFEFVDAGSDLPTEWADGQPDPKAASEAATSGSSGPGETSAGPPT